MRLITKELLPSEGQIICPDIPYSIPQHFGQFNHLTVAGALGIERSYMHFMPFYREMLQ